MQRKANVIPMFPSEANDDSPAARLRELADAYESGEVGGVLITYVTSDGAVKYQVTGALTEEENIGKAIGMAEELRRRLEQMRRFFSPR